MPLVERDAPRHTSLRATLLSTGVARAAVERAEPAIARRFTTAATSLAALEQAELMTAYVRPNVREAVADALGVPAPDRDQVFAWATEIRSVRSSLPPDVREDATRQVTAPLRQYVLGLPLAGGDGVVERLAATALSEEELVMLARTLYQAGIGSTARLLGNLLYELARTPALYERLLRDRLLVPIAIEEALRLRPPGVQLQRVCTADAELDGSRLRPGDRVVVDLEAANRDPAVFARPDEFRLDRENLPRHLGFGQGRHRCVGARLARTIARHGLEALLDHVESLQLASGFEYETEDFAAPGPRRLDVLLGQHL